MSTDESTVATGYRLSELRSDLEATGHNISHRSLQNWITSGELRAFKVGRQWRISESEYKRIMQERGGKPSRVHPERKRAATWSDNHYVGFVRRKYRISPERYEAMCEANGYRCTLCEEDPRKRTHLHPKARRLNIDHDHNTGEVRGLLCQRCNKHVAFAGDNVLRIRRLLDYVEGRLTKPEQARLFLGEEPTEYVA